MSDTAWYYQSVQSVELIAYNVVRSAEPVERCEGRQQTQSDCEERQRGSGGWVAVVRVTGEDTGAVDAVVVGISDVLAGVEHVTWTTEPRSADDTCNNDTLLSHIANNMQLNQFEFNPLTPTVAIWVQL